MTRLRANMLLLTAGAIWGMGFIAQSAAMDSVGPWTFTSARFVLAALTLLPFAAWETRRAGRSLSMRDWGGFAIVGALLFLGTMLQQLGLLTTSVTNAGFITGLYVVMTPVLALLILRTRPHWVVWPSAALALAGILMVGGGGFVAVGRGDWLMIAAAAAFALQILFVGLFSTASNRPLLLSCVQFATVAVLASAGMAAFETPALPGLRAAWPLIVYGGCISAGVAFTLQTIAQRHTSAPQAAILLSSEALFAALFGALLLGERIAPVGYGGCALIFSAILAVELVPLSARRTLPAA